METEARRLRDHPGGFMMAANPFETCVGHFWGIVETITYMRFRFAHMEALEKVNTGDGAAAQLEHIMDMFRLCRSDNMGLRDFAPHVMLRLGKDQEAYDFCKWWATTGYESDNDRGNMDLPFLDTKNADVFEEPTYWTGRDISFIHAVCVTLLKIKLLRDLTELRNALRDYSTVQGREIPFEIVHNIQTQIPRSQQIIAKFSIEGAADTMKLQSRIDTLTKQVRRLHAAVHKHNSHFWTALDNPRGRPTGAVEFYFQDTDREIVFPYTYNAWLETPGVLEVVTKYSRQED